MHAFLIHCKNGGRRYKILHRQRGIFSFCNRIWKVCGSTIRHQSNQARILAVQDIHTNKFKNVRKMKYQDLIKYPSGIKEGTEVSIDLVPADYDFNYLDLVHGGKVSETHSLLPNWSSKIAAGNEWPYSNMAGITFITVTGYHVAKPSWVAIEHLIFFLSKSISHWQSFQGLLSNWQFFTLKKMTNSMVL